MTLLAAAADEIVTLLRSATRVFDPGQPRDPHTGEWVDVVPDAAAKAAAAILNSGGYLDDGEADEPEHEVLADAIYDWASGGYELRRLKMEMQAAVRNGGRGETRGAVLLRTIAAAPANAPTLYRGKPGVNPADIPDVGGILNLAPSSFSRSAHIAWDGYDRHSAPDVGLPTSLRIQLAAGSRSLSIENEQKSETDDLEYIAMGRFRVTDKTAEDVTVETDNGDRVITRYVIQIEPVE